MKPYIVKKQYFSKLYKRWVDFKHTDCESTLKKYGYKIRLKEFEYEQN